VQVSVITYAMFSFSPSECKGNRSAN